jgi:glycosyltransferase involved in cell wall biosynthesis
MAAQSGLRPPLSCDTQTDNRSIPAAVIDPDSSRCLLSLYIVGVPGSVGGASTKLVHLLKLLRRDFKMAVVAPELWVCKDKRIRDILTPLGVPVAPLKDLPRQLSGVALGMCDAEFFSSGRAQQLKARGLKVVWSNEMMWPFRGESEAAKQGVVDRVLFVSELQAKAFAEMYQGTPSFTTGNYIDPDDYSWRDRKNPVFTVGRLSRPDTYKYPLDFPVFYEEIGLKDVRYRVMAWSPELQKQYRWHRFGKEWDLLPAISQSALKFLYSLDVFLYPLGHRVKESWGRAVVEAMLTGAVPVVPTGHQFHKLIVHGESGFICKEFHEFKDVVRELYENYPWRTRISRQGAEYAREHLCNPEEHRKTWIEALTF